MRRRLIPGSCILAYGLLLAFGFAQPTMKPSVAAAADDDKIDFERAKQLFRRRERGEKLSDDEAAYLKRAIEARNRVNNSAGQSPRRGELTPRESVGLKPLNDMKADDRYLGEDGGLYGKGLNTPPDAHRRAAENELAQIRPLNVDGKPDSSGCIGFISISMSNATQEFSRFKQVADNDAAKSSKLTIVDCAQGGQAMAEWVSPSAPAWRETDRRLQAAGVSPQQVQVVWIKLANKGPTGTLEEHGRKLQRDTRAVLQNAKAKFPNVRIAYLSSRIYGGYTSGALNPEPYAYESAFAVRWLIQDQIAAQQELNFDPSRGTVKAPLLLWGPYLWADGTTPRQPDKLSYKREDLAGDGTHPSELGRDKVARVMLTFFKNDPLAKSWFVGQR